MLRFTDCYTGIFVQCKLCTFTDYHGFIRRWPIQPWGPVIGRRYIKHTCRSLKADNSLWCFIYLRRYHGCGDHLVSGRDIGIFKKGSAKDHH